ncbi:hypothetical protein QUC31_017096 [Theobroma cacao]
MQTAFEINLRKISTLLFLQSVIFTGVPGYAIGLLWLLFGILYGGYLAATAYCCKRKGKPKTKSLCHNQFCLWPILLAVIFTILAIAASGLALGGTAKFHSEAKTVVNIIMRTANGASETIYNTTGAMKEMRDNLGETNGTGEATSFLTSTSEKLDVEAADIERQARKNRRLIDRGLKIVFIITIVTISLNLVAVIALSVTGILRVRRALYCWREGTNDFLWEFWVCFVSIICSVIPQGKVNFEATLMANPPGNHQQEANHASSSFNGGNLSNGSTIPDSLGSGMKHNTGIALDWTLEEQAILDEGLKKFASESSIIRYAKIAMQLQNKTVRDVALRCRWMTKKENSKRRKEEHNLARKSKDKKASAKKQVSLSLYDTHMQSFSIYLSVYLLFHMGALEEMQMTVSIHSGKLSYTLRYLAIDFACDFQERVADPSTKPAHFAARPNVSPYAPPMIPMDYDDGIPYKAIGGATGELLEQNAQAFNQISANLAAFQIQENIGLLCQTRDNILKIMNESASVLRVLSIVNDS